MPAWLRDAAIYQIYPQSFADSNGDGIGDLPGLIGKLDYIASLGVTAIWLNPFFASPFRDAGYDVTDFRQVAPRYGGNADARRLFREAHRRGLRVILDLVAGHTSVEHPWFRASCRARPNRYSQYYYWTDSVWKAPAGDAFIKGYAKRDGNYLANFFWFQPALNYGYAYPDPRQPWQLPPDHPACRAVREELRGVMKYWLDAGCDGFRVDMAASLIKGDRDGRALRVLWRDFRGWLARNYPEAVLISEWGNPRQAIRAGFHIDFLLHFGEPAHQRLLGADGPVDREGRRDPPVYFQGRGSLEIGPFLENYLLHYRATRGRGLIALPTSNHDFPRPSRGRSPRELRTIFAMLLTMPGVPTIYYGDEIGLRWLEGAPNREGAYRRAGSRTPMQWRRGRAFGFSTAPARKLYLPTDPRPDAPTVETAERDPDSLLHLARRLLRLRREHPALGNFGGFVPLVAERGRPFVYRRQSRRERVVVVINGKAETRACAWKGALEPLLAEGVALRRGTLVAPPFSFGIFQEGVASGAR